MGTLQMLSILFAAFLDSCLCYFYAVCCLVAWIVQKVDAPMPGALLAPAGRRPSRRSFGKANPVVHHHGAAASQQEEPANS
jgi:hypothetical protein